MMVRESEMKNIMDFLTIKKSFQALITESFRIEIKM